MTTRAVFVGGYRMGHAIMAFQFDNYIESLDKTYIVTNIAEKHYKETLKKYVADPNRFEYVNDEDLIRHYPQILNWDQPDDYRGTWLRQQALKIAALDYFDYEHIIIQDPDTFCIQPYLPFNGGVPNFFILPNTTQSSGYYRVIEKALGITRQTRDCFVSEFMPFIKDDWYKLKTLLEERNQKNFLDAIIDNCVRESGTNLIWFSEYEFLANFVKSIRPIDTTIQTRFEIRTLNDIKNLDAGKYNCYVDACPNLQDSILFEFTTDTVIDFDQIHSTIVNKINETKI